MVTKTRGPGTIAPRRKNVERSTKKSALRLTGQQVLDLWDSIRYLKQVKAKARFNFAIEYNERILEPVVSALQTTINITTPTLRAYYDAQDKLLEIHKDTNAEGPPGFVAIKDRAVYNKNLKQLREQHEDAVREAEVHETAIQELCAAVVDPLPELARVPLELVPDDLPGSVYGPLACVIMEPSSA